jgi:hypothetical protein
MALVGNSVGFLGITCFLVAYFLLQKGTITAQGIRYLGLNLIGAILVMISLLIDWNLSAFLLEAAWALISIYGIYIHLYKKRGP